MKRTDLHLATSSLDTDQVYLDVHSERIAAHAKHKDSGRSMEQIEAEDLLYLAILSEEFGEVCRAICDDDTIEHLRTELVQVAAVACAWVQAIDHADRERIAAIAAAT